MRAGVGEPKKSIRSRGKADVGVKVDFLKAEWTSKTFRKNENENEGEGEGEGEVGACLFCFVCRVGFRFPSQSIIWFYSCTCQAAGPDVAPAPAPVPASHSHSHSAAHAHAHADADADADT